jgi:glucose/arabinose dehydrogenase
MIHLTVRISQAAALLCAASLLLSACAPAQATQPAQSTSAPQGALPTPSASTITAEPSTASTQPQAVNPTATQAAPAPAASPTAPPQGVATQVPSGNAAAFPNPDGYAWNTFVSGLVRPVDLTGLHDGSGRLLVLEQPGDIRMIKGGQLLPGPFLDLSGKAVASANERGLLGIAVHPKFADNGFFYVNYTDSNGNTVIARFHADHGADKADPSSEMVLLRVRQPYSNHNGGSMVFGPDGFLYMGLGDGGNQGDPQSNGQNTRAFLGKLLRVDVNSGRSYAIPGDNPFADGKNGLPEVWAYGLRNPWRFSFDRATGDLYIGDVGQNSWEEIDFLPAGSKGGVDFGWNYREGKHSYKGGPPADLALTDPVVDYPHPEGCSVTGGFVYRGKALPEFEGIYLYGDYCSGWVYGLIRNPDGSWQSKVLFQSGVNISSFGQDDDGELYLLDHNNGAVLKLVKK